MAFRNWPTSNPPCVAFCAAMINSKGERSLVAGACQLPAHRPRQKTRRRDRPHWTGTQKPAGRSAALADRPPQRRGPVLWQCDVPLRDAAPASARRLPLLMAVFRKAFAEDRELSRLMAIGRKGEAPAIERVIAHICCRPARDGFRKACDIGLLIAPTNAEGMQFKDLAARFSLRPRPLLLAARDVGPMDC